MVSARVRGTDRHDPEAARFLLDRVLERVGSGEAEAVYIARDAALTRFANSQIHQNVAEHDATIRIRTVIDGQTGVASTNRLDEAGLKAVVERAVAIRDRAARNPETPPLASGGDTPHTTMGWVPGTATTGPEQRAAQARAVIAAADGAHLEASGAFSTDSQTMAVANTGGLRSSESATQAKLITVVMDGAGGSGYAQGVDLDAGVIDGEAIGAEAVDKAVRSAGAGDLEPGEYPVVLEAYAVATVLEYLSYIGFSALTVQEGRSFMELGRQVMGSNVTIWDDGHDPAGMPSSIDFEGIRKQRVALITAGEATGLVHDSATAQRAGIASTGHGLPAPNTWGPLAWNLFMAPGSASRDELLHGLERGIWVTRFHYVNIVHGKRAILTGMTKDGTFLVEHGQIVRPIRNFRFTQSIPEAFSRISAIGSETRLVGAEYSGINARVPALLIDGFAFTGATAAEGGA
jgi:PmbA protein